MKRFIKYMTALLLMVAATAPAMAGYNPRVVAYTAKKWVGPSYDKDWYYETCDKFAVGDTVYFIAHFVDGTETMVSWEAKVCPNESKDVIATGGGGRGDVDGFSVVQPHSWATSTTGYYVGYAKAEDNAGWIPSQKVLVWNFKLVKGVGMDETGTFEVTGQLTPKDFSPDNIDVTPFSGGNLDNAGTFGASVDEEVNDGEFKFSFDQDSLIAKYGVTTSMWLGVKVDSGCSSRTKPLNIKSFEGSKENKKNLWGYLMDGGGGSGASVLVTVPYLHKEFYADMKYSIPYSERTTKAEGAYFHIYDSLNEFRDRTGDLYIDKLATPHQYSFEEEKSALTHVDSADGSIAFPRGRNCGKWVMPSYTCTLTVNPNFPNRTWNLGPYPYNSKSIITIP